MRGLLRVASAILLLALLLSVAGEAAFAADCAETNARPYQPTYAEVKTAMVNGSSGLLGPSYPKLPDVISGYPEARYMPGMVPCILPQAMAWLESGWRQAGSGTRQGTTGPVLTGGGGCGYGVMQISSGMQYSGQMPRATQLAVANDYVANVAFGLQTLAGKWNFTPAIGNNDPTIAESWYYAVWAYNTWSWRNNPNNPDLAFPRATYDGTQPVKNYPYQELIFGLAANPPKVGGVLMWDPVPLSLPDSGAIGSNPDAIPPPAVMHRVACAIPGGPPPSLYLPLGNDGSTVDRR